MLQSTRQDRRRAVRAERQQPGSGRSTWLPISNPRSTKNRSTPSSRSATATATPSPGPDRRPRRNGTALPRRWRWRAGGRGPDISRSRISLGGSETWGFAYVLEAMLLAPPLARAAGRGRWEGRWLLLFVVCLKNKNKIKSTPPQPSPCYAKGGGKSVSSTVRR